MANNVISLNGEPISGGAEPRENVIRVVKQLLEQAESGQIQDIIILARRGNGNMLSVYSLDEDSHLVFIAALQIEAQRLITETLEREEPIDMPVGPSPDNQS